MPDKTGISRAQLLTLHEVSKKINSQLNFQKLLDEIMDLVIEHLKAEKGLLLLKSEGSDELTVQAARMMDKQSIQDVISLSRSVIKKVQTEGKPLLLERIPETQGGAATSSMVKFRIKSVICVPLHTKEKLIGTIYLDTTNTKHLFKPEDLVFLESFANLAGIAIINASSYREIENLNSNLENLVSKRTGELQKKNQELQQANQDLKSAQLQLIRTEKMASLGQLVAGIAHEINTPLASITSNTGMFQKGFEKLHGQLEKLKGIPAEVIKPVFILENLTSINKIACERIISIVKSLRNFARLDEEEFKTVDLHEGIENTLSLTEHLNRGRIKVSKDYGSLPPYRGYANQLNQVFMNMVVNAMQAIKNEGELRIKTRYSHNEIKIIFEDNGIGILPENIKRIFDPGFTTKGVGIGTGLGLSISYTIVQEHGGSIHVNSQPDKGTSFELRLPLKSVPQNP